MAKNAHGREIEMEFNQGNVIMFENLTYETSYWGIVTNPRPSDHSESVEVMVINNDLTPAMWITGEVKFDRAFFQNRIFEHFETLADYIEWKEDEIDESDE